MRRTTKGLFWAVGLGLLTAASCSSRSDFYDGGSVDVSCRVNPADCDGEIGGRCFVTDDCADGICCTDDKNCGGGMCLFRCQDDRDCPENQACEHDVCFFRCSEDADCGPGQKCEHGNTVCEYD